MSKEKDKEEMQSFELGWPGNDTVCGWGSTMEHTKTVRAMLPRLLKLTAARSMNDAGCGDLFWIQHVDLGGIDYVGYDLYERSTWPLLRSNNWKLETLDIVNQDMREADFTMCRDVFIHLPNRMVLDALDRIKRTSKFLFATNFISSDAGEEQYEYAFDNFNRIEHVNMHHSKLDLRLPPFNLGNPIVMIIEDYPYKNTSLWEL